MLARKRVQAICFGAEMVMEVGYGNLLGLHVGCERIRQKSPIRRRESGEGHGGCRDCFKIGCSHR